MHTKSAATDAQLQARLGLRSSNAAQKHKNKQKELTRPGKRNRRAQKAKAIREQH